MIRQSFNAHRLASGRSVNASIMYIFAHIFKSLHVILHIHPSTEQCNEGQFCIVLHLLLCTPLNNTKSIVCLIIIVTDNHHHHYHYHCIVIRISKEERTLTRKLSSSLLLNIDIDKYM